MAQSYIAGASAVNIADSVEAAIHAARLKPGDSLPTVRDLAGTLAVSPTTVAAAYKLLRGRGLVSGLGRNGTQVTSRPPTPAVSSRPHIPDGAIDLATGNPDPELLPPLDQALRVLDPAPRMYDGPTLIPALTNIRER
jgi:DNA-binding transcriptional MocR family regulator